MKERPILFSPPMVQAILDGRKLQTRRANGLEFINNNPDNWKFSKAYASPKGLGYLAIFFNLTDSEGDVDINCPYGKPGDLLWVRERFTKIKYSGVVKNPVYTFPDQVINPDNKKEWKWKPSIHMPKKAARIWLEVTDVRVERLQDISEEDAVMEGIERIKIHDVESWKRYDGYYLVTSSPVVSFWSLWASINSEESWQLNPWVWVVSYKVLSTTGREGIVRKEVNHEC